MKLGALPKQGKEQMPSLTLEDIAKETGVSRSTVSRVINNNPNVSEDVRKKVQEAILRNHFQPHAAARALASQRTSNIGLILPQTISFFFTDPYYAHLTKGIAQACNQHDYTLAFFLVGSKEDEDRIFPRVCHPGMLDGVVVQSGHHGDQGIIGRLVDADMPFVVLGRPFRSDNVTYLDIDNINASYHAVTHLIRQGRTRIATITGPLQSSVGIDRLEGYKRALTDRGLPVVEDRIAVGDFTEVGGYYAMQRLLPAKPDAVFAASDAMAIGAIRATREAGLKIPADIAFVGFDDLPMASFADIQLTTMRQPVVQFGVQAVETLIDKIQSGNTSPQRIIMDTELIIRDTCGANNLGRPQKSQPTQNVVSSAQTIIHAK
jgi:LacI family transcriptional regulator